MQHSHFTVTSTTTAQTMPVYQVRRSSAPIQIDGVLDEWDWIAAERLQCRKFSHEPEDEKPLREQTQVAGLWDDKNLYLAFVIQDREIWSTIDEPGARLFPEECVEFFLDPDGTGERYVEAQINSRNNIRDLLVDGSIKSSGYAEFDRMALWDFRQLKKAMRIYEDDKGRHAGWTLELAIPWRELSFSRRTWPPQPGDELRINFYRYERPRSGDLPLELSAWSPVLDFHDPSRFGRFVFVAEPAGSR